MRMLILAAAAAVGLFSVEARAQTPAPSPEQLALAREVVAVSGAEDMMNDMLEAMAPQMADQIVAGGASREFAARFVEIFREEFARDAPRVTELISLAYAGAFTEAQLRDLHAFYLSPTGQALIAKMPALTAAMTQVGVRIGEDVAHRSIARLRAEQQRAPDNP